MQTLASCAHNHDSTSRTLAVLWRGASPRRLSNTFLHGLISGKQIQPNKLAKQDSWPRSLSALLRKIPVHISCWSHFPQIMAQAAGPSTLTYQPHVLASVLRSICVTTRCLLGEAWAPVPGSKLSFELVAAYAHGPGPVRVHVKTEAGPAFTQTLDASFIRANKKSHSLALRLCEDTVERGTVVYSYSELDTDALLRALEYRFHTALAVPVTLEGAVVAIFVLFASQPLNVSGQARWRAGNACLPVRQFYTSNMIERYSNRTILSKTTLKDMSPLFCVHASIIAQVYVAETLHEAGRLALAVTNVFARFKPVLQCAGFGACNWICSFNRMQCRLSHGVAQGIGLCPSWPASRRSSAACGVYKHSAKISSCQAASSHANHVVC